MPVIGTPAVATSVTLEDIRTFMRDVVGQVPDTGVINILLDGVEFSDRDIRKAIATTVGWFNALTPMIGTFSEHTIPHVYLLYGSASHLLASEAMRQLRNQSTTQDGDTSPIGIDDKYQLYNTASMTARQMFLESAKEYKMQLNKSRAYGGIGSGYAMVSRNHGGAG